MSKKIISTTELRDKIPVIVQTGFSLFNEITIRWQIYTQIGKTFNNFWYLVIVQYLNLFSTSFMFLKNHEHCPLCVLPQLEQYV